MGTSYSEVIHRWIHYIYTAKNAPFSGYFAAFFCWVQHVFRLNAFFRESRSLRSRYGCQHSYWLPTRSFHCAGYKIIIYQVFLHRSLLVVLPSPQCFAVCVHVVPVARQAWESVRGTGGGARVSRVVGAGEPKATSHTHTRGAQPASTSKSGELFSVASLFCQHLV